MSLHPPRRPIPVPLIIVEDVGRAGGVVAQVVCFYDRQDWTWRLVESATGVVINAQPASWFHGARSDARRALSRAVFRRK